LRGIVKKNKIKTILYQTPPEGVLVGAVAKSCNCKALWLVPNAIGTGMPFDLNRRIYRAIFRFGNVVPVSNSSFTDSTLGAGSYERKVVHLGVDTSWYTPGSSVVRDKLGISRDEVVIGIFARITPSKGQKLLLDTLIASEHSFHILLCGGPSSGEYFSAITDKAAKYDLISNVHILKEQQDLRPYYRAVDIVANLQTGIEGFGLTIVEAMACEKPVLAHKLGGPSEIILDNETGWLIEDTKVETISRRLDQIFKLKKKWKIFGENGRERVKNKFSREKFVSEIELLIKHRSDQ